MERNRFYNGRKKKGFIFLFALLAVAALAGVVMVLWNAIFPDVMPVSKVNYWQALGILVLSKILFGGFKGGPPRQKKPFGDSGFRQKFMSMSQEERDAFKAKWKERCMK